MAFGFGKKAGGGEGSKSAQMRETLFGDMAWAPWSARGADDPWKSFREAREAHETGDKASAVKQLRGVLAMPALESRHYLQAWTFLRQLGETPADDEARHVYGAVIEVGMPGGLDLLAAYEDGSARYWNFSGAGIIWDKSDDLTVKQAIADVLERAERVIGQIGPWKGPRPPAPVKGIARLNILAPLGLHFGQAAVAELAKDDLGGPMFLAATQLMKLLVSKSPASPHDSPKDA